MQPFLAMITPISDGRPDQGLPGQPPGIWGGRPPPYPDQGLPGQPPGIWGGRPPNYPDQGLPGQPPGIWGGRPPNYPDQGLPGQPPGISGGPGQLPPWIMPPIAPGGGGGQPPGGSQPQPPGIWGGGNVPMPTPPIYIPPGMPPVEQPEGPIDWKTAWTPQTGWIVVGVPSGGTEHPAPSPAT